MNRGEAVLAGCVSREERGEMIVQPLVMSDQQRHPLGLGLSQPYRLKGSQSNQLLDSEDAVMCNGGKPKSFALLETRLG